MSDGLEAILQRVADGDLTPEQALHLLDHGTPVAQPSAAPAAQETPAQPAYGTAESAGTEEVTCIRLKSSYRSIQVYADPEVAQLHVTGRHAIRQEGAALVVTTAGPLDEDERGEPGERDQSTTGGRFSFSDLPKTIAWARSWRDHQLIVRVNPALAIELDTTGAEIKVSGLKAGLQAHLVASSLKADKLHGYLDVEAFSSSVKLSAVPTGSSRLYCESSSARLTLLPDSDVTITATNRMSRLVLPDQPVSTLPFEGETSEVTIGAGRHQLSVEGLMSSVTVNAEVWDRAR
jgi:hypothetical protein